eukprot:23581-Hanusia_phi.AAC.1
MRPRTRSTRPLRRGRQGRARAPVPGKPRTGPPSPLPIGTRSKASEGGPEQGQRDLYAEGGKARARSCQESQEQGPRILPS